MKRKFIVKTQLSKQPGIYKISCTQTDKIYIGESVDISARIQKHFSLLRKNKHSNPILQNIYNKYGEETFIVDVLEYTMDKDDVFLKELELKYQKQYSTCISLDSNIVYHVERSDEWKQKQKEYLDSYREKALEEWRIPIIIYDLVEKRCIKFKQIKDAAKLIECKHLYTNIKDNILIPYKNRYVAFKESEFSEDKLKNIIITNTNTKYSSIRTMCELYNLLDNSCKKFASKQVWSLEFSDKPNWSLYDKMLKENLIDWNFRTPCKVTTKKDFLNLNIYIKNTSRSKKCNIGLWLKGLQSSTVKVEISKIVGIDRRIISESFKDRSQLEWVKLLTKIIATLPD